MILIVFGGLLFYAENFTKNMQENMQAKTTDHIGQASCSYMIFQSGATTYAENCNTSNIDYSGTNPATVINSAIAALTNGGKVFIKAGTYTLTTTPINLGGGNVAAIGTTSVSGIELYGEGLSTILSAGTNLNGVVIGVLNANNWYIHDLQVNGNRASQTDGGGSPPFLVGIEVYNSNNTVVENCYVHDDKTYGIQAQGTEDRVVNNYVVNNTANGIIVYGGSDYVVQGNVVDGSSDVGISISGVSSTVGILNVVCSANIVKNSNLGLSPFRVNSAIGIMVGDNGIADNVTVSENQIFVARNGIYVSPSFNVLISDNQIAITTTVDANSADIYVDGGTYVTVQGNLLSSASDGVKILSTASSVEVLNNNIRGVGQGVIMEASQSLIEGNYVTGSTNPDGDSIFTDARHTNIVGNTIVNGGRRAIGLDSGSDNSTVSGNVAYNGGKGSIGLEVGSTGALVSGNSFYTQYGIALDGSSASRAIIIDNDLRNNTYAFYPYDAMPTTGVVIEDNAGYNPLGHISSPFITASNLLVDAGLSSTPTNATTITNSQSPKTVSILISSAFTAGYSFVLKIDGAEISSITAPSAQAVPYIFTLQPGETFYCQYQSGDVTFTVSGQ
jgi:hypothetical protein